MASLNTTPRRRAPQPPPQLPPQGGVAPRQFEPSNSLRTHEGAPAAQIPPELALRRAVCACLLWENEFYESGQEIAARIAGLAQQVPAPVLARLAVDARSSFNLRHVPLLLCAVLARTGSGSRLVGDTIARVIQRADELAEFVAVYAKFNGVAPGAVKKKLSAQTKRGLALAFEKFNGYQLAKYCSPGAEQGQKVKARDVMFMTHPKPRGPEQHELWKDLINRQVKSADTWEVALSIGPEEGTTKTEHKRETFERQLRDGKLGYLALLRNLRNMVDAGVDPWLIEQGILERKGAGRVLPFRYVAAARACPSMRAPLDRALGAAIDELPALAGRTVILVDVSGSMEAKLSGKSDLNRMDAAAALASLLRGEIRVFTFSNDLIEVSAARGLSGIDTVINSQHHGGTELGLAITLLNGGRRGLRPVTMDRLIVITDEQAAAQVPLPHAARAYMINVASNQHGVGYGEGWTHIDGFSEQVIRFIDEFEKGADLRRIVGYARLSGLPSRSLTASAR